MEQRNNLLIALVAVIALVVGLFVGMNLQSGDLQGKLSLSKDASKRCEEYKSMFYLGNLTDYLGGDKKAAEAIKYCEKNYPIFWNSSPTTKDCLGLKNREIKLGSSEAFSEFMKKKGISFVNAVYCGQNHPYLWYEIKASNIECWNYKDMYDTGKWNKIFNNNQINSIIKMCTQTAIGWAPAIDVDQATCETYITYLAQGTGVLSAMIEQGSADAQIAFSCSTKYPDLWYK